MRNYLINLARRGAGLPPAQSPRPSRTPDFYGPELTETETDALADEFDSTGREMSESVREEPALPAAADAYTPAVLPQHETPRADVRAHPEESAPPRRARLAEPSQESPRVPLMPDAETRTAQMKTSSTPVSPDVTVHHVAVHTETGAQRERPVSVTPHVRLIPAPPVETTDKTDKDERLAHNLSVMPQPYEATPPRPENRPSVFTPVAPKSSAALESENEQAAADFQAASDFVYEGARVTPEPQAAAALVKGSRLIEAAPQEKEPRIEVRIGRVEVRFAQTPAPPVRQPSRPRGFGEYARARRYLDRNWY
jgi:hypothetical protein